MKYTDYKIWASILVLSTAVTISGWFYIISLRSARQQHLIPQRIDLTSLQPGGSMSLVLDGVEVLVSVPKGEGFSYGTFKIFIGSLDFDSGSIDRDGSLETAWLCDVNSDAKQDAVFVVRNAGSGSYVEIVVLESFHDKFKIHTLAQISTAIAPGYMGHDKVSIENGLITRSFPTYINTKQGRIDRQWKPQEGLQGQSPYKIQPDSNSEPSGKTLKLHFNYTTNQWEMR